MYPIGRRVGGGTDDKKLIGGRASKFVCIHILFEAMLYLHFNLSGYLQFLTNFKTFALPALHFKNFALSQQT